MEKLSTTDLFQQARCIAIYHALPQEVQTAVFIEKWYQQKKLALPLVQGNDLLFLPYTGKDSIQKEVSASWNRLSQKIRKVLNPR